MRLKVSLGTRSRKRFAVMLIGLVLVLSAMSLTACSDESSTPTNIPTPVPSATPTPTDTPTTVPTRTTTSETAATDTPAPAPSDTPAPIATTAEPTQLPPTLTPVPLPSVVQNLEVVSVTEESITLRWKPPANRDVATVERYEVTRDVSFGRDEHHFASETTFTDAELRSGTEHTYRVRAIGVGGVEGEETSIEGTTSDSMTSEPVSTPTPPVTSTPVPTATPSPTQLPPPLTPVPIPGVVQNLEVASVTEDSITLRWKVPGNSDVVTVECYEVTRDVSFGRDEHHFASETTFTNEGLRSGTEHRYRVRAIGVGGAEGEETSIEGTTSDSARSVSTPTAEPTVTGTPVHTATPTHYCSEPSDDNLDTLLTEYKSCKPDLAAPTRDTIDLLIELEGFREDPEFHRVGFGSCCRFNDWLKEAQTLRDTAGLSPLSELGVVPGEIILVGQEYITSAGQSTEYTGFVVSEIMSTVRAKMGLAATPEPSLTPTPGPADTAIQISEEIKEIVIGSISGYQSVQDAAIDQEGRAISLVLVVASGTNEEHAKELGENFVRMLKSLSQDEPPSRVIGSGIYDYMIGVYDPNGESLALGVKARTTDRIRWSSSETELNSAARSPSTVLLHQPRVRL